MRYFHCSKIVRYVAIQFWGHLSWVFIKKRQFSARLALTACIFLLWERRHDIPTFEGQGSGAQSDQCSFEQAPEMVAALPL